MPDLTKSEALLRSIDQLIENHGRDNPKLLDDLLKFRASVQEELARTNLMDIASTALKIATWVKFIIDHLPP